MNTNVIPKKITASGVNRLLAFALSLCMILALSPAFELPARAASVSNLAQLQTEITAALDANVPATITVTAPITIDAGQTITLAGSADPAKEIIIQRGVMNQLFIVNTGGSLTLENITIDGNMNVYPDSEGALVYIYGGTVTMNSGAVLRKNSNNNLIGGGGVHVHSGSFYMNDGSIIRNEADTGGGIACTSSGNIVITGGEITENCSTDEGGGVYIHASSTVTLGGTAKITGNQRTSTSTTNNLHIGEGSYINLLSATPPVPGMAVGVTKNADNGLIVQSGATADIAHYFTADASGRTVVVSGAGLKIIDDADKRTVAFNSNGGTGEMTVDTVALGSNYSIKANTYTRAGYAFLGWNTSAGGSETAYAAGATIADIPGNITLYAQWGLKTISAGAASGPLTALTAGTATYALTTANIANGQTGAFSWFTDPGGATAGSAPSGLTPSVTTVAANAATVTMNAASAAAGTYYFKVTIDGVTSDVMTLTVNKAIPAVLTWPSAGAITYGAALSSSAFSGGSAIGTWAWTTPATIPTVTNSGYSVTFTPTDTANYDWSGVTLTQSVEITVNKATIIGVPQTYQVVKNLAYGYSFDLSTLLPSGMNTTGVSYSPTITTNADGVLDTTLSYSSGSALTLPVLAADSGKTAILTVTVSSGNYNDFTALITVETINKVSVSITAAMNGGVYNGSPFAYSGAVVAKNIDQSTVTGIALGALYESTDGAGYSSSAAPVNAGAYKLTLSVPSGDASYSGSNTFTFTITKKALTITADNKNADVGAAQPVYTYAVTGMVSGETAAAAIATAPTASCPSADMDAAGVYTIEISGGVASANYEITSRVNGTLTVIGDGSPGGSGGSGGDPGNENPGGSGGDPGNENAGGSGGSGGNPGYSDLGGDPGGTPATPTAPTVPTTPTSPSTGDNKLTTPADQPPVMDKDGNTTLPGGGTVETPGGVTINAPAGTIIDKDGNIAIPSGMEADATLPGGQGLTLPGDSTIDSTGKITTGGDTQITFPGNKTLDIPKGSAISNDVKLVVGVGGATYSYAGMSLSIEEGMEIIFDENVPLGYYVFASNPFTDVDSLNWYYDSVMFAYTYSLMTGTSVDPKMFDPNMTTTRAMIVAILYRMAGSPDTSGLVNPFGDVGGDQYYADAVIWAANNGIVGGYGGGLYGPEDNITREQLAVILNRFIAKMGVSLPTVRDYIGFNDDADIANYAKEAIERFFKAGVVSGKGNSVFDPKGNATRAEVATVLMNFLEAMTSEE